MKAAFYTLHSCSCIFCVLFNGSSTSSVQPNVLGENYLRPGPAADLISTRFTLWAFSSSRSRVSLEQNLALGHKKVHRWSITWLVVFPTAIFMYSNCIPFHWNSNRWVICLHKRVPFTSSHAGVGPRPEDLLIAHIHFSPDAVQNKPTYTERDVQTNFLRMLDAVLLFKGV